MVKVDVALRGRDECRAHCVVVISVCLAAALRKLLLELADGLLPQYTNTYEFEAVKCPRIVLHISYSRPQAQETYKPIGVR